MRVFFLIRTLVRGGAERQLVTLAKGLKNAGHEVSVAVFYANGALEVDLTEADVTVVDLAKRGRWDLHGFVWRLYKRLRYESPDVLYSSLAGSNICATLLGWLLPGPTRVVCRIASAYVDLAKYDRVTRFSYWLEARLARFCSLVICNSRSGVPYAVNRGFPERKIVVIPNGFDADRFSPDLEAGNVLRKRWGIPPKTWLVGLVARLDPIKDHATFLAAAALLAIDRADVWFVCVGGGDGEYLEELQAAARERNLGDRLIWAGEMRDMPAAYSALDIAVCSSYGEGFPNVVGEAMACETPCVVTDVGDAAWLVGDSGEVVVPGSAGALVAGLRRMLVRLECDGRSTGVVARKRIVTQFSVERLMGETEAVLDHLVSGVV